MPCDHFIEVWFCKRDKQVQKTRIGLVSNNDFWLFLFLFFIFITLFIFGCAGSLLLFELFSKNMRASYWGGFFCCRLPRRHYSKEPTCQCRRLGFNPWVGKIPWRRKWQPTPVFLPGKSHEQRGLMGYSPWGHKELDRTEHTLLYYYSSVGKAQACGQAGFSSCSSWALAHRLNSCGTWA